MAENILERTGMLAAGTWESLPKAPPVQKPVELISQVGTNVGAGGNHPRRLAHRFERSKEEAMKGSTRVTKPGDSAGDENTEMGRRKAEGKYIGEFPLLILEQAAQFSSGLPGMAEWSHPKEKLGN